MKIQIIAGDGKVIETIENVHESLKSQHGMGELLEQLLDIYRNKYSTYMWEMYQRDRRSGEDRRHLDGIEQRSE